jgi:carbamoyltransferase
VWVLGINARPANLTHDASACLVDERGAIVAYAEEERFVGVKQALRMGPRNAVAYVLRQAGIGPKDVDVVAVGWDVPYVAHVKGLSWNFDTTAEWLRELLGWEVTWRTAPHVVFVRHHVAHASLAYHGSGYDSAAIVITDGNGEDDSISIFHALPSGHLVRKEVWPTSHSLGWMYDAATKFLGFEWTESGKTMGLAAYGDRAGMEPWPLMVEDPTDFLQPPFKIPTGHDHQSIVREWLGLFEGHAGGLPSLPRERADQDVRAVHCAHSVQRSLEQQVLRLVAHARLVTDEQNVCLAGGVALNCSANGLVADPLYVPPVPHDAGVSIGAAWSVVPPVDRTPLSPYLGPLPSLAMPSRTDLRGLHAQAIDPAQVREALDAGRVGAIVEGRAEAGPRALCHRSILASASPEQMRDHVNRIKSREPWRPLGPVGLETAAGTMWRDRDHLTRYMIGGVAVTEAGRAAMPAAVHVDGTSRPQRLGEAGAAFVRSLLEGEDVLINTSFNGRGQPMVNTGREAIDTFRALDLDFLVLQDRLYAKTTDWWRGSPA